MANSHPSPKSLARTDGPVTLTFTSHLLPCGSTCHPGGQGLESGPNVMREAYGITQKTAEASSWRPTASLAKAALIENDY
jgi:hypothetical protein